MLYETVFPRTLLFYSASIIVVNRRAVAAVVLVDKAINIECNI